MNVGEYVRTKNKAPFEPSQIAKITDMKKDEGYNNQYFITLDHNLPTTYNFHIYSEDVIKSSPNIIDLIEEGDYVNGYKVLEIEKDYLFDYREEINVLIVQNGEVYEVAKKIYSDDIKSIVTKEQFEAMQYKAGE